MAKKDVAAIVSGMGLGSSIIDSVVREAKKAKLSDEVIHSLGTPAGERHIEALIRSMMDKEEVSPFDIFSHSALERVIVVKRTYDGKFTFEKKPADFAYASEYEDYLRRCKESARRMKRTLITTEANRYVHIIDSDAGFFSEDQAFERKEEDFPFLEINRRKTPRALFLIDFGLSMTPEEAKERLGNMGLAPSEWVDLTEIIDLVELGQVSKVFALGNTDEAGRYPVIHKKTVFSVGIGTKEGSKYRHSEEGDRLLYHLPHVAFSSQEFDVSHSCQLLAYPIQ